MKIKGLLIPLIGLSLSATAQDVWTGIHLKKDIGKRFKANLNTELRIGEAVKTFVEPSIYYNWKFQFKAGYRFKANDQNRVFVDAYKGIKLISFYLKYRFRVQLENNFTIRNKVILFYKNHFVSTEISAINYRYRATIGSHIKMSDNAKILMFYRWQTPNNHITGIILKHNL